MAAIWVLFFHFGQEISVLFPTFEMFAPIYQKGYFGVDIFFVLSGYIITYVYAGGGRTKKFEFSGYLLKRIARVYPNHILAMGLLLVLVVSARQMGFAVEGNYSGGDFAISALLLQSLPFNNAGNSWNYPSWSVSAELFGYIAIFPLTLLVFKIQRLRLLGFYLSIMLCLIFGLVNVNMGWGKWQSLARITFEFSAGASLFYGLRENKTIGMLLNRFLPFLIVSVLTILVSLPMIMAEDIKQMLLYAACPLLIGGLSFQKGFICKSLSLPFVRYLGLISYALYMFHALVEKVFKVVFPVHQFSESGALVKFAICCSYFGICFIVAASVYHLWEEPVRKRVQGYAGSPKRL